jgi:major type 1 subunit fimbrin (pilin)
MKLNIFIAILLSLPSIAYSAETKTTNAGRINFVGQIVNPACEFNTSTHNAAIKLGELNESELSQSGKRSKTFPVQLQISTCEQSNANTTDISIRSLENSSESKLLGLINQDKSNAAKNVAIELLDQKSKVISLNGDSYLPTLDMSNGGILNLSARYVATGKITSGKVMSAALIQIEHH